MKVCTNSTACFWKYAKAATSADTKTGNSGGAGICISDRTKKFQEIQIKELCQRAQPYNIQKSIFPISIKQFEFLLDKTILISNIWNKIEFGFHPNNFDVIFGKNVGI